MIISLDYVDMWRDVLTFRNFRYIAKLTPVKLCKLTVLPADFEATYFIPEPKQKVAVNF